jgi:uncharacterized membrane protein YidH (DUF202 family)
VSDADPRGAVPDDEDQPGTGLASERTELAWTRSSIAFFALGIAVLKVRPAIGIPITAIGVVIWLVGRLPRARRATWLASRRELLVTVAVTTLALAALVLTIIGPASHGLRR